MLDVFVLPGFIIGCDEEGVMLKNVRHGNDVRNSVVTCRYSACFIPLYEISFCLAKRYFVQQQNWRYLIFIRLPLRYQMLLDFPKVTKRMP